MLKEKIELDFKQALKEKREIEVSALRMLKAAIFNKEKEKRYGLSKENPDLNNEELEEKSSLTDEEILNIVFSKTKRAKESISEFEKGKRQDLVEKEKEELKIFKSYLPEQLSEKEIKKMAEEIIVKTGAKDIKDMGKVMSELMPKVKGKAEGAVVSKIIKELLFQS